MNITNNNTKTKYHFTMLRKLLSILIILTLGYQYNANACTIIAVGKKASADGSNIISHTDTGPDSRIFVVPAQTFKPGEKATVYWGIQDADRAPVFRTFFSGNLQVPLN